MPRDVLAHPFGGLGSGMVGPPPAVCLVEDGCDDLRHVLEVTPGSAKISANSDSRASTRLRSLIT
jgi:hypothetical protein